MIIEIKDKTIYSWHIPFYKLTEEVIYFFSFWFCEKISFKFTKCHFIITTYKENPTHPLDIAMKNLLDSQGR